MTLYSFEMVEDGIARVQIKHQVPAAVWLLWGDSGRSRAHVRDGWQRGGSNDLHLTFLGDIDTMTEHS